MTSDYLAIYIIPNPKIEPFPEHFWTSELLIPNSPPPNPQSDLLIENLRLFLDNIESTPPPIPRSKDQTNSGGSGQGGRPTLWGHQPLIFANCQKIPLNREIFRQQEYII